MLGMGGSGESATEETSAAKTAVDGRTFLGAESDTLLKKGLEETSVGEVIGQSSLKLLMFYFSMHNCPPCREFTPLLDELYQEMNEQEQQMEVVFFSGD